MANKKHIKRIYNAAVIALTLLAFGYVCSRFMHFGRVEYTDDAQVWRHITPLHARVGGFIKEIRFDDYSHVRQGDTLIVIEDAEYRLQLAEAEAMLTGSQMGSQVASRGVTTTEAHVRAAAAGVEEARVRMENARADYERYAALMEKNAVTRQQYDAARTQYEAARARFEQAASQQLSSALTVSEQAGRLSQAEAGTSVAEARVRLARLNLSYTVVVATCDGIMSRKDIHVGQLVQPGQELARIVDDEQVWVVANYRETQLHHIGVGQAVEFTADAVPGITYTGRVERISGGTGAAFSGIPVDNATGNFVKVEQRVPVRIRVEADSTVSLDALLAGMNVECEVKY